MISRVVFVLAIASAVAMGDAGIRASLGLAPSDPSVPGSPRVTLRGMGGDGGSAEDDPQQKPDDPGDPREVCSFADMEASYEVKWAGRGFALTELRLDMLPRCKVTGVNIALYDMAGADIWTSAFVLRKPTEIFPIGPKPPVDSVNGIRISIVEGNDEITVPGLCAARLFSQKQVVAPSDFDNVFVGTGESDKVLGTWRRDLILGHGAGDKLIGFTVPGTMDDFGDTLDRATREQSVKGLLGGDCIDGAAGDDRIKGHIGNDVILGGPGDDEISGGLGHDIIDGGPGFDICVGGTLDGESELTEAVWRDEFINCEVVR